LAKRAYAPSGRDGSAMQILFDFSALLVDVCILYAVVMWLMQHRLSFPFPIREASKIFAIAFSVQLIFYLLFSFFAIDYKAFEFRAMVDTAGEKELAAKIEAGLDPHQAAADLTGVTRKQAKTLGFGLLYGMGVQKLSAALGLSLEEGKKVRNKYFEALPKVQEFIRAASWKAEKNKFVVNRFGRPYFFPDTKFSYKAANCLIQGGTAEAIKFAMVKIDAFLEPYLSKMVLQIHDELLFEIHDTEHHLVPGVQKIMEEIWPSRIHKMGCSVDWSKKSWGELEEYGDKTGNIISSEGSSKIKDTSEYVDISYPTGVNQGHTGLTDLL